MKTYLVTINYLDGTDLDQCLYHAETFHDFITKLWDEETEGDIEITHCPLTDLLGLTTNEDLWNDEENIILLSQIELFSENSILEVFEQHSENDTGILNIYEFDSDKRTGLKQLL